MIKDLSLAKNAIFLLSLAVLMTNCKALKKTTDDADKMNAEKVRLSLLKNQVRADWLNANAKISLNGGGMAQSASANIRMQKDSLIWMSVKKLGFEIARALITRDSVYVLDRFNRQYIANDLEFLSKSYNLPANLLTLQAVLLGNPIFLTNTPLQLEEVDNQYRLFHEGARKGSYWLGQDDQQLNRMKLEDAGNSQKLDIKLSDYRQLLDNQFFSHLRQIEIDSKETGASKVELVFQKVELNAPKSVRFEVPKGYNKVED
ncbi:MAG: DUF4292 domain-containing protein [Bacteroidota bacterium]